MKKTEAYSARNIIWNFFSSVIVSEADNFQIIRRILVANALILIKFICAIWLIFEKLYSALRFR